MKEVNGKNNYEPRALDVEHELPEGRDEAQNEGGSAAETEKLELERLRSEREALLDRAARLQAEFDNYRKRQVREQQDFRDYALADALKSLLPILDSFDMALATGGAGEDFRDGIDLINRQLHDTMAKLGVQPLSAKGEHFDPTVHQAVQMVETTEAEDNQVLEELQRGYKLKGRLLRPAMVRVARNPGK